MNIALKLLVCGFSFAFTAFFIAMILSALFSPLAGAFQHSCHSFLGAIVSFAPLSLAILVGIQAARVGLRHEEQRQSNARAKNQ